ncbi:hypothetical protein MHB84_07705 [Paenibacillus sp. FSL F4-0087]|uniref:hypothetical protein n=1 Tax=Paenibacillus sp. FSL F4-0087 TaxID=2921368 RepID=UPI0030FAD9CA
MKAQVDENVCRMDKIPLAQASVQAAFIESQQYPLYYYVVFLCLHCIGADHHGDAAA